MTASSIRAWPAARQDGWCSTTSATWVMVKTKTRSKNSSRVETRLPSASVTSGAEGQLRLRRAVRRVDAVEQAADRLAAVDARDRLGEQRRHRADRQLRPLLGGLRDGVGRDDLADHGVVVQPGQGLAREEAVRAGDRR